jgi:hypothetical protein
MGMFKIFNLFLLLILFASVKPAVIFADTASTNYIFKDFSFGGSGGITSSSNYSLMGVAGDAAVGTTKSTNYAVNSGLAFTLNAYVPSAPTLINPANYYNKLNIVLNTGSNPTDTQYAIAISPDNFATTVKYIQTDDTMGNSAVWQTKSLWGSSGFTIIGLTPGTTYTASVSAMQGKYTQTPYGPTAQAATVNPSLSFSVSPNSVPIGQLTPATVVTAPSTVTVSISSNGTNGSSVYVNDSTSGLFSPNANYTIAAVSGDLGSLNEGYGIRGSSTTQSSGGPMEILSPYNQIGSIVGTLSIQSKLSLIQQVHQLQVAKEYLRSKHEHQVQREQRQTMLIP